MVVAETANARSWGFVGRRIAFSLNQAAVRTAMRRVGRTFFHRKDSDQARLGGRERAGARINIGAANHHSSPGRRSRARLITC